MAEIFIPLSKEKSNTPVKTCGQVPGIYIDTTTLALMRSVENGNATTIASSPGGYQQTLVQKENCRFAITGIETDSYIFAGNALEYITRADKHLLHRIEKISPSAIQLNEMAGSYYSDELGVSYTLFTKEGSLYLKFFDVYDVPLTGYEGDFFAGEFLGTNVLHFVKTCPVEYQEWNLTGRGYMTLSSERNSI